MEIDIEKIAKALGASYVGDVGDVPFGASGARQIKKKLDEKRIEKMKVFLIVEWDYDDCDIQKAFLGPDHIDGNALYKEFQEWVKKPENRKFALRKDGKPFKDKRTIPKLNYDGWVAQRDDFTALPLEVL